MNVGAVKPPMLRGVSHQATFIAALTLAPIMIVSAPSGTPRLVIAFYTLSIAALFGVSALYHRVLWSPKVSQAMQRLDHVAIFVAIGGTYTPVALFALSPWAAKLVLTLVWSGTAVGVFMRVRFTDVRKTLVVLPYLVVGWSLIAVVADAWHHLGAVGFLLLLIGGLTYTAGALVFAFQRPDPWPATFGFHEVFHVLTVAGATLHYVAVAFVVLPMAN